MELRQNMRRATTRPMAWVVAMLLALMLGLMVGYVLASIAPAHPTGVGQAPVITGDSPRNGGPGGQIGDSTEPNQTSRGGGPGGRIGDVP